jgi:hypothetical protein
MEGGNNNNNNNQNYNGNYNGNGENYYGSYYIGPYCNPKDGKSIHLGVFYDQGCTAKADVSVYASKNYGKALPFADTPIVGTECNSCMQVDQNQNNNNNNNNNNQNNYQQEYEVTELCEQSYEEAARCEEKMSIQWKDTSGCDYINNILPRLESASRSIGVTGAATTSGVAAKAFAGIFAFTTVLFAAYAYFLYRKIKRGSVNLSDQ